MPALKEQKKAQAAPKPLALQKVSKAKPITQREEEEEEEETSEASEDEEDEAIEDEDETMEEEKDEEEDKMEEDIVEEEGDALPPTGQFVFSNKNNREC